MFKALSFTFENDFQKLRIELDVSNGSIRYRIPESENLDFVQKDDSWKSFDGDCGEWISSLEALDVGKWNEARRLAELSHGTSKGGNIFPESEVKWSLSMKMPKGQRFKDGNDALNVSGRGSDSYPVNFTNLLELFMELLNLPVLLLEL